jgi:hypothetical protein
MHANEKDTHPNWAVVLIGALLTLAVLPLGLIPAAGCGSVFMPNTFDGLDNSLAQGMGEAICAPGLGVLGVITYTMLTLGVVIIVIGLSMNAVIDTIRVEKVLTEQRRAAEAGSAQ